MVRNHGPGVNINTVARSVGTSTRQLQRVFSDYGGTFRQTIAAIRMKHARKLLADSNVPISQISEMVGYTQPGQFSKAFRHYHGRSPREYRRAARRS